MSLSQIIKQECPVCKKIAVEIKRTKFGKDVFVKLQCGHEIIEQTLSSSDSIYESIRSSDGKSLKQYQINGIKALEGANAKCILADEQGLGKTIQAAVLLRLHRQKLLPAILVVPTTVKVQWAREIMRWCVNADDASDKLNWLVQIINSGKEKALPGFALYIVTYDLLKNDDVFQYLPNVKTIIIDECQRIKNHLSDRAKAVQKIAKKCEHIIPMSGTPIKNNAGEYFTVLNLVKPTLFPQYQTFIDRYCDAFHNGWAQKVGGLKDPERFHDDTKDIIIRRVKADVLKDLPPIERNFFHVELDPKLNKAYAQALKELDDLFYSEESAFERSSQTIAIMSKMRHITGVSKVESCVDFVTEFLLSSDRKITIFVHHQDTMEILKNKLNGWCITGNFSPVLVLHSGLDGNRRAALTDEFKNGSSRVMIASTLASGEGVNLQFCSDAVILERQWNPANEEQAEARFHRFGQQNSVSITYMIASGTIDEYFTELIETKRSIVSSTMDNKSIQWDQQSLMKELSELLVTKGRQRWSL